MLHFFLVSVSSLVFPPYSCRHLFSPFPVSPLLAIHRTQAFTSNHSTHHSQLDARVVQCTLILSGITAVTNGNQYIMYFIGCLYFIRAFRLRKPRLCHGPIRLLRISMSRAKSQKRALIQVRVLRFSSTTLISIFCPNQHHGRSFGQLFL